ncbi:uncharacterized protein LOC120347963 [Styela clava]
MLILPDVTWIILNNWSIILCLLTSTVYSLYTFIKRPRNFPPGPRGIPILGVAPFVGSRPEVTFAKWSETYGDIIGFKLGSDYTVVLNSYDAIQEALVKNSSVFNNRPDNFIITEVLHKKGITMNDYTPDYIVERKFAQTSLSKLGFGKSAIENSILDEAKRLMKLFGNNDVELNDYIKKIILNCSGNIIAQVVIGKRFEYEDDEFEQIADGFDMFFKKGSLAYQMTMVMPWLSQIPPVRGSAMAIRKGMEAVSKIMTRKIDEHERTMDKSNVRDFVDEYLVEMKKRENKSEHGPYSKKMLDCMIRDLFGAGMETVQGTLIFSCLILANRPHLMERIHEEIDDIIGIQGIPQYSLRDKMPLCHAFLKEVMRYKTFAPLCIPHCTSKNIQFRGYEIPKGTTIFPNLYAVHNDSKNWENPEKFNPDRHINAQGRVKISKYFMPFGMGPRMCIGRCLGEMELFIFFVTIFQKYKVVPTNKSGCKRPHVNENAIRTGLAMCPPPYTPVTLKRRVDRKFLLFLPKYSCYSNIYELLLSKTMSFLSEFVFGEWNYLGILLCSILTIILFYQLSKRPKNFPPGPRGIPFLGAAPLIGNRPEITFSEWRKTYGDIIGFRLGMSHTVVLNNYELIQEALVKHGSSFSHRPDNYMFKDILFKNGITSHDYTPNFIIERKFTQTLLSKLGFGKSVIESAILDEIQQLMKHFGDKDVQLDATIKNNMMNCVGNVVGQFVFGKRYDYDDPELLTLLGGYDAFFKKGTLAYQLTTLIPWTRYIEPVKGSVLAIIEGLAKVKNIMIQKIDEHEKSMNELDMRDFIDEYLVEMKRDGNSKRGLYSKFMLTDIIRDLYGAGMETVHGTLIFSFILLANRPEILKKIQEEIDDVIGSEGLPHYNLREKMPFCRVFLKEVLRFKSNVPLAVPHCTSETITFRGYTIPKGTTVLPNIYAIHHDPELWDEPEKFKPERHLDSEGNINISKYFMPFGLGPRLCIGRRLAEMELFIFLISICQRYDVIPTPRLGCERPRVDEDTVRTGLVMCPPLDTPVTLKRRCVED